MIVASNLCKRYPGGYEAVKDVSFAIDAGQMKEVRRVNYAPGANYAAR